MELLTPADAAGRVTAALKSAAEATGAGFDYLLRTATRESSLNATAKNPSSSARGLFQFIDSTWLEVMKEEGPGLGMGAAAGDIAKTASGRYVVADPARRAEILAMRDDPQASALLGAAFTRRNAQAFENGLGRAPSEGELYAAHFMGAQGAIELTSLATATPTASAAAAFPSQASANRSIFYDGGRARTAREVYDRLTATPSGTAIAATSPAAKTTRPILALQATNEASVAPYNGGRENDGQAFHSLFKTGRRTPVASYVQQAWAGFGSAGLAADGASVKAAASAMGYAAAPTAAAATPRAEAAAAAVDLAGRARAAKPRAAATITPRATPAASGASITQSTAVQPAPAAVSALAGRKVEPATTFLGIQLPSWLTTGSASSTARGRP
ncbi:lytic transglycosylase domain-containing protein [Chenggangzhangella methanolivorans]